MRWVERYKKDGNVDIHYRKQIAYKVKKEYVEFLEKFITGKYKNKLLIYYYYYYYYLK